MKKEHKNILIGVGLLLSLLGAWYFLYYRKRKATLAQLDALDTAGKPAKSIIKEVGEEKINTPAFPLKRGSEGEAVKKLQIHINAQGYEPILVVDGLFGPKTEKAVQMVFKTKAVSQKLFDEVVLTKKAVNPKAQSPVLWRVKRIQEAIGFFNDDEDMIYQALSGMNADEKKQFEALFLERYQINHWSFLKQHLSGSEMRAAEKAYETTA